MNWFENLVIVILVVGATVSMFYLESFYVRKPLSSSVVGTENLYDGLPGHHTVKDNLVLTDSSGSRAYLYRGQERKGAFFGGSTMVTLEVDQKDQLSLEVAKHLGDMHIENHSAESLFCQNVINRLAKVTGKFDFIAISTKCLPSEVWEVERIDWQKRSFSWSLQSLSSKLISLFEVKKRNLTAMITTWSDLFLMEPIQNQLSFGIERPFVVENPPKKIPEPTPNLSSGETRWVRNLRKAKLVKEEFSISAAIKNDIEATARKMFLLAKKNAKRVFFISRTVAYDENEHAGVARKWKVLIKAKEPGAFKDNYSYASKVRLENKLLMDVALENGVEVIDLDSFTRTHLRKSDAFFFDHIHLTEKGIELASKYIADKIQRLEGK